MSDKQSALTIDDFTVLLEKKPIRHLYIRVSMKDGSVRVSAPKSMSSSEIRTCIHSRRDWILKQQKKAETVKPAMTEKLPAQAGYTLRDRLVPMIPECEKLVGQRACGYRLQDMSSRWGSCSLKTRQISLNLQLYDKDDDCLRYVLIHELTHFYVPNHGPAFYYYMDQFYPEWRSIRKKLRGQA